MAKREAEESDLIAVIAEHGYDEWRVGRAACGATNFPMWHELPAAERGPRLYRARLTLKLAGLLADTPAEETEPRMVQIVCATSPSGEGILYGLDGNGRVWWRDGNVYCGGWQPIGFDEEQQRVRAEIRAPHNESGRKNG